MEKQLKSGKFKTTEFFVREIDEYGDVINNYGFETLKDAKEYFQSRTNRWKGWDVEGCRALVLERKIMIFPMHLSDGDKYKIFNTFGDSEALVAGEWK